MADTKLSNLSAASALTGAESLYVVQSGTSKKTTVGDVTTAVLAGLPTGAGLMRMYRPASYSTVAISTAAGASARIAIPAGVWTANSVAMLYYTGGKVTTGTSDTPSVSVYVGATAFTPSGGTNRMCSAFPTPASANAQLAGMTFIHGNGTDLTTVLTTQQANNCVPFSQAITFAAKITSSTLNLANAWDIVVTFTTGSNDTAAISEAWVLIFDPTSVAATTITVKEEGSTLTTAATSIDFVGSSVTATNVGGAVTVTVSGSGGGSTTWQTYTPNVSNAVPITIDYDDGPNVILDAPVDDIQVVAVPSNMPDGSEMEIDLTGGDGSGSWTTWSAGTPSTDGYVFLVSGVAPTADASATMCTPCFVKRRGHKYEVTVAPVKVL